MIFLLSIIVLDWIIRLSYVTVLVPAGLLAARYRNLKSAHRWFLGVLICRLLSLGVSDLLYRNNVNPNYAGSVYYIVVVIFFAGFFFNVADLWKQRKVLLVIMALHMLFSLCNLLFIQKETLNTYSSISLSVIVITLCLIFFYRLLKNLPTENLLTLPSFWIVTAEFIVTTGQMLMESFAHFLINIFNDNLIVLWVFHHGLGIGGNLILIYATWLIFKSADPGKGG